MADEPSPEEAAAAADVAPGKARATRLSLAMIAACSVAWILAFANARVAQQVHTAGGGFDPALIGQALLLIVAPIAVFVTRRPLAGLVLTAGSLWVYQGMAALVGTLATSPPEQWRIWVGPMEGLAFAFFPLAFFGWRAMTRSADNAALAKLPS